MRSTGVEWNHDIRWRKPLALSSTDPPGRTGLALHADNRQVSGAHFAVEKSEEVTSGRARISVGMRNRPSEVVDGIQYRNVKVANTRLHPIANGHAKRNHKTCDGKPIPQDGIVDHVDPLRPHLEMCRNSSKPNRAGYERNRGQDVFPHPLHARTHPETNQVILIAAIASLSPT